MDRSRLALFFVCLLCAAPAAGLPIRGRVLDAGGAPLTKVKVRLVPLASVYEAGRLALEGKDGLEAVASTESGAEGGFLLEAPEPGMWKVVAGAGDGKLVPQEALAAPLLGELDLPAVRLRRGSDPAGAPSPVWHKAQPAPRERPGSGASGSTVPLRVLGADGKPAAGVLVLEAQAVPEDPSESGRPLGMTGETGLVELATPKEAPLDVLLVAADGRHLETRVLPRPGKEPRAPQDARLPALVEFPVQVTSAADGRPLAGALVWKLGDPGGFRRTDGRGTARLTGGASDRKEFLFVEAAAPGFLPDVRERLGTAGQSPLSVSLQPGLTLAGLVVTETGAPVAGAEITLAVTDLMTGLTTEDQRWSFEQRGALVRSGPEGRFRWSGLAPDIHVELRVAKDGFAPARIPVALSLPARPAGPLRIVLHRGASAFGRVLGPGDQPIAGARVTLEAAGSGDPQQAMLRAILQPGLQEMFEAVTGADGRFDLAHLPAGRYDLSARGHGWAPLTVPGLEIPDAAGGTDLGTLVLARGVALEGEVVDAAGKPVEGAEIRLQEDGEDVLARLQKVGTEPDAVSGPDGFFRIEDLRAGSTVDVSAERPGYAPGSVTGARVAAEAPLRITLQAVGAVSGRVVDPDGRPIAGATVRGEGRPWGLGGSMTVSRMPRLDRTGADGSFRITEVIPGLVSVFAQASGWQDGTVAEMELTAGEEKRGLEIVLSPAALLEGQVLSSSGRPVSGAQVELSREDRLGGSQTTITDADGRYVLDSLPPGLRTVEASHPDHGVARRQVELRVGESSLDLTLEGGREVSGRVVDDAGAPVAGAQIWLISETAEPVIGRSQGDGGFRFPAVEDGSYRAMVSKDGFASPEAAASIVVEGSPVTGLELRLGRGGVITGRITGVEVADLARVQISAQGRGGRISVDGTYRIDSLPEGSWMVQAELPGTGLHAEGVVRLEPGVSEARLDLEMERGLVLSGRVRRNGAPVAGETVFLSPGGLRTYVETDTEGRFRFQGLSAGTHHLQIRGSLGRSAREETIDLQADREITIDLPAAEVTGRVVDAADLRPVRNATVQLLSIDGKSSAGRTQTDSQGVFVLRGVAAGTWRLRAQADGYAPGEASVQVEDDGPPDGVEISLRSAPDSAERLPE